MIIWQVPLAAVAMSLSLVAGAQSGRQGDPAESSAPVPPTKYESAFSGYQPYREETVRSWRDVNDTVRRAAAEARQTPAALQPAPLPAHEGKRGEGMQGK